ncbi:hypothetical protein EAI_14337, partial [Harpegnathos saltator]
DVIRKIRDSIRSLHADEIFRITNNFEIKVLACI